MRYVVVSESCPQFQPLKEALDYILKGDDEQFKGENHYVTLEEMIEADNVDSEGKEFGMERNFCFDRVIKWMNKNEIDMLVFTPTATTMGCVIQAPGPTQMELNSGVFDKVKLPPINSLADSGCFPPEIK